MKDVEHFVYGNHSAAMKDIVEVLMIYDSDYYPRLYFGQFNVPHLQLEVHNMDSKVEAATGFYNFQPQLGTKTPVTWTGTPQRVELSRDLQEYFGQGKLPFNIAYHNGISF